MKTLPFIPVWCDIFWQTRCSSHARRSRCESASPRSFKLSREAASPRTDPHALLTQPPSGGLRRILTLETQSAELRPMSNNWPDRGYATPTADPFAYPWPQHLESVTGGAGGGGHLRGCTNAVLSNCLWHLCFCWSAKWLNRRGSNSSHRKVTLSRNPYFSAALMPFTDGCSRRKWRKEELLFLYDDAEWPKHENDITCVCTYRPEVGDVGGVGGVWVFTRISSNTQLEVL